MEEGRRRRRRGEEQRTPGCRSVRRRQRGWKVKGMMCE